MTLDYILFNYFLFQSYFFIFFLILLFFASFISNKAVRAVLILSSLCYFLFIPFLTNLGSKRICSFLDQTYETCSVYYYKRPDEDSLFKIEIKGNFKKSKNLWNIENKKDGFLNSYDVFIITLKPQFQFYKSDLLDELIYRKKEILEASESYFKKQLNSKKGSE